MAAGLLVLALPALVVAAQSWTVVASPITVEAFVPTDVTVTVENTSTNNSGSESIGCVRITIPSAFAVQSASITSTTNNLSWAVSTTTAGSTLVEAVAKNGDRLRGVPDSDVLVMTITVTGGSLGSYDWIAEEYEKEDCTNSYDQPIALTVDIGTGANDPPDAAGDGYSTLHDRVLSVAAPGVLDNDTDRDFDPLDAVLDSTTASGTLVLAADGSFEYTPDPGFVGTDTFTYHADDGSLGSSVTSVTIDVTDVAPTAVDDDYTVDKNASLSIDAGSGVLANDIDPDAGDALTVGLLSGTTEGTLVLFPDGAFDYTPDPGFSGVDTFSYQASDGAMTSTATVTLTVVNREPNAADDLYNGPAGVALVMDAVSGVLANDIDPDGDSLTASVLTPPANGVLLLAPDGAFTYTPLLGFDGTDQFTYEASDGSLVATATVTIGIANDAPVAVDDEATVLHDRVHTVAAPGVLANDTDANGDGLIAVLVDQPSNGTLTLDPDGGYTYTPDAGYTGPDSFTYRADDDAAMSGLATVAIDVTNLPPSVADDAVAGAKDRALIVGAASGVLANDDDADGDVLVAALASGPAAGSLALAADGSFTYTPNAGFIGSDSFGYTASDGIASATGTVTITISNSVPASADDSFAVFRNQTLTKWAPGVLAGDTDADGDDLTATLLIGPAHGTLGLAADGGFTYTPEAGYAGLDVFAYRASDGTDRSAPATVQIEVKNRKPVAGDDSGSVDAGDMIERPAIGLLENDLDADGDTLIALLGVDASHGNAAVRPDGGWSYVPDPDFVGDDSFSYVAFDGLTTSAAATVHITVRPISPPPEASPTAESGPAVDVSPSPSPSVSPSTSPSTSPFGTPVPGGPSPGAPDAGEAFFVPGADATGSAADDFNLAAAALAGFGSILWAVPSLILSVPGLLLVVAIMAQAAGGLAWLPVARRKVGSFGIHGRRARQFGALSRS